MCVVSMVMDHYWEKWNKPQPYPPTYIPNNFPFNPDANKFPAPYFPTKEEVEEFRKLLERAREYDKRNNEPDCELEEKRERIKKLAEELGIDISFV